jgi:hypothetical protein
MSEQQTHMTSTHLKMGFTVEQLDMGGYVVNSEKGSKAFTTLKEVQDWFVVELRRSFHEDPSVMAKRYASESTSNGIRLPEPNTPAYRPPLPNTDPGMMEDEDFYPGRAAQRSPLGQRLKSIVGLGT